jgi:4'-phosphopantetheinyl transferase
MMREENLRLAYFYDLWTLKESYIKYLGKGLSVPLNAFEIVIDKGLIHLASHDLPLPSFKKTAIERGYAFSLCAAENSFADEVKRCKIHEILDKIQNDRKG